MFQDQKTDAKMIIKNVLSVYHDGERGHVNRPIQIVPLRLLLTRWISTRINESINEVPLSNICENNV